MLVRLIVPRRATAWVVVGLLVGGASVVVASASCSSTPPRHDQCTTSKDCMGATCVPEVAGNVCELPEETTCSDTLPCVVGLICADDVCRAPCVPGSMVGTTGGCLEGQTCVPVNKSSSQYVCVDDMSDGGKGDAASGDSGRSDEHSDSSSDDGPSEASGDLDARAQDL